MSKDALLAWQLHNKINCFEVTGITEEANFPDEHSKENYIPKTLIDKTLEIIDPTPNIYTLFRQFNNTFFWGKLIAVEVRWSSRMTSCAGTCTFSPKSKHCIIALSSPLLKLRPRKDLVETLLHEMIHAYLFITNNSRDRDGHGPDFCKHMNRINLASGTKITIYHNFHDEVRLYQVHWWKCNGPCQNKAPFFGTVRRATNRAPGPSDFWFKEHQLTCGGQFIKIRGPEKTAKSELNKDKRIKKNLNNSNINNWLTSSRNSKPEDKSMPKKNNSIKTGSTRPIAIRGSYLVTVNKNNTNAGEIQIIENKRSNIHGFGTGGSSSSKTPSKPEKSFSYSGTLGGSSNGESRLLKLFPPSTSKPISMYENQPEKTVKCPICEKSFSENKINIHVDECLQRGETENLSSDSSESNPVQCPVCLKFFSLDFITDHVEDCLKFKDKARTISKDSNLSSSIKTPPSPSIIVISDSENESESISKKRKNTSFMDFFIKVPKTVKNSVNTANCPVCGKDIRLEDMNGHLDDCLSLINEQLDPTRAGPSKEENTAEDHSGVMKNMGNLKNVNVDSVEERESRNSCLICNIPLDPSISLTEHLDDCLRNMFDEEEKDSNLDKNNVSDIEFSCPVCKKLFKRINFDGHLDKCTG